MPQAPQHDQNRDAIALVTSALASQRSTGVRTQAEIEGMWDDAVMILRGKSHKEVVYLLLTLATMNASLLQIVSGQTSRTPEEILQSIGLSAQE